MCTVLNTLSESTYFCKLKNITSHNLFVFKIIETLQCILDPDLMKQAEKVKFSTVFKGGLEPPFSEGTPLLLKQMSPPPF